MRIGMSMTFKRLAMGSVVLACAFLARIPSISAQSPKLPEEFTAIYTNIGTVGAVGALPVNIRISRWTTDVENEKLMSVLAGKGTEALVRVLSGAKSAGSIGTPQELPYDLRYARQSAADGGGRRIILMTDRPMDPSERMSSARSKDYPLTWIELHLDNTGRGEGTISLAVRLRLLGDVLGIEDLGNQAARLNEVKKVK